MSEWQPIETAPKDGTRIDLWIKWWRYDTDTFVGRRHTDCLWSISDKKWCSAHPLTAGKVTHWIAIPAPPTAPSGS